MVHPNQIDILEEPIPTPKKDEVLIKNRISGISAGTEMLFYRGLMPTDMLLDESIPSLKHQHSYPFKYGYCSIGDVIEVGDKKFNHLLNQRVFVFNPHESYFCAKEDQLILLPESISLEDAVFLPNMETAINLLLDGMPMIGENVLVFGLGVVGLLTTALLCQFPLSRVSGIDLYPKRRNLCLELGGQHVFDDNSSDLDQFKQHSIDLIYELTGNPDALNSAISLAGYESRIVLGSWYGRKPCHIDLGGKFHRHRIKVIASQVSTLASKLQGRWTKERRLDTAIHMLEKIKPTRFISHQFHITDAQKAYQLLQNYPDETVQVTLTYGD